MNDHPRLRRDRIRLISPLAHFDRAILSINRFYRKIRSGVFRLKLKTSSFSILFVLICHLFSVDDQIEKQRTLFDFK